MTYPDNPFIGQTIEVSGTTKQWNGYAWINKTNGNKELRLRATEARALTPHLFVTDTSDADQIAAWLQSAADNNRIADIAGFALTPSDTVQVSTPNGITIVGKGSITATGSQRDIHLRFTQVRGLVAISDVLIDGADLAAKPLVVENTGGTGDGQLYIGVTAEIVRGKTLDGTPNYTAIGCRVHGRFEHVVFEGKVDGVDSAHSTNPGAVGLATTWNGTDYCKSVIITSAARIFNTTNSVTLVDCDGINIAAPTGEDANLVVQHGARFHNNQGRHVKSQVQGNAIYPYATRNAMDGLIDVDVQYGGGVVGGRYVHTDSRVNSVVNVSGRVSPDNQQCLVQGVDYKVKGTPSSNTDALVSLGTTDETVDLSGIVVSGNRVDGGTTYFVSVRTNDDAGDNKVTVVDNWSKFTNTSFINSTLFGTGRAQLDLTFERNVCENGCAGATLQHDVTMISQKANQGIGNIKSTAFSIVAGAISPRGDAVYVSNEGGATFDNLDTVNLGDYSSGMLLSLFQQNAGRTTNIVDTGNIVLKSGTIALDQSKVAVFYVDREYGRLLEV